MGHGGERPFQTVHTAQVMPWQGLVRLTQGAVGEPRLEERAPALHKGLEGSHLTGS